MRQTGEIPATTVLFVCTANRCRSVMAEWGFRGLVERNEVWQITCCSAGIAAVEGAPPTQNTLAVLREHGMDAAAHRATPINRNLIEEADITLAMTRAHLVAITDLCPEACGKTSLLGRFSPDNSESEISDPYGLTLDGYRACFAAIESCFGNLMKHIRGEKTE